MVHCCKKTLVLIIIALDICNIIFSNRMKTCQWYSNLHEQGNHHLQANHYFAILRLILIPNCKLPHLLESILIILSPNMFPREIKLIHLLAKCYVFGVKFFNIQPPPYLFLFNIHIQFYF